MDEKNKDSEVALVYTFMAGAVILMFVIGFVMGSKGAAEYTLKHCSEIKSSLPKYNEFN